MNRVSRSAATILRLATLASRFVLIFFLARLLSVDEVGFYGLFAATVSYMLYIAGFDFYTYSTRELIRSEPAAWPSKLRSHVSFATVTYAFVLPASIALFVFGLLPWSALLWFLVLLPLEHLGMELDRVLIALGDNLAASVGLFLRQATTPLFLVPLMLILPELRSVETVLAGWVIFDVIGILVALVYLRRHLDGLPRGRTDWSWVRVGIRVSLLFLISTLCLRLFFVADRQIIYFFGNLEALGAYTLFMGIAAGLTNVVSAGVHQFVYPKLVSAAHREDSESFRRNMVSLAVQTAAVLIVLSSVALAATPILLSFIGKEAYVSYSWMLPWALGAISLYNASLIPHFALYAVQADKWLLWSTVAATLGFVAAMVLMLPFGAVEASLGAIASASTVLIVTKSLGMWVKTRQLLRAETEGHRNG